MNFIIVILFLVLGLLFEFKYKIRLYNSLKERLVTTALIFIVLMGWELINLNYFQAWLYPGPGMLGFQILGLPFELYLFFITSPYFALIVYQLIHKEVDS